jgi:hypothetical protein
MIILDPVQIAECEDLGGGALPREIGDQLSRAGSYLPPVFNTEPKL